MIEIIHRVAWNVTQEKREVLDVVRRMGEQSFLTECSREVERLLMRTGPREFRVSLHMDAESLVMVVVERHRIWHLLARLFWSPLEIARGKKPWRLSVEAVIPLELALPFAAGVVCGRNDRRGR